MRTNRGPSTTSRNTIIAVVVGLLFLAVPTCGVLVYGTVFGFEVDVQPGDRDRVLTLNDLDLGNLAHEGTETLNRTRYIDGTYEVGYDYTSDELDLWSSLSFEQDDDNAHYVYIGQSAMAVVGVLPNVKVEAVAVTVAAADEHDFRNVYVEGELIGHYGRARAGALVLSFMVTGITYTPEELRDFVTRWIDRARSN